MHGIRAIKLCTFSSVWQYSCVNLGKGCLFSIQRVLFSIMVPVLVAILQNFCWFRRPCVQFGAFGRCCGNLPLIPCSFFLCTKKFSCVGLTVVFSCFLQCKFTKFWRRMQVFANYFRWMEKKFSQQNRYCCFARFLTFDIWHLTFAFPENCGGVVEAEILLYIIIYSNFYNW